MLYLGSCYGRETINHFLFSKTERGKNLAAKRAEGPWWKINALSLKLETHFSSLPQSLHLTLNHLSPSQTQLMIITIFLSFFSLSCSTLSRYADIESGTYDHTCTTWFSCSPERNGERFNCPWWQQQLQFYFGENTFTVKNARLTAFMVHKFRAWFGSRFPPHMFLIRSDTGKTC